MEHWCSVLGIALLPLLVMAPLLLEGAPPGKADNYCSEEDDLKLEAPGGDFGRVLVCRGEEWRRVCDEGERWTKEDATVTCRQLGYPYPEYAENLSPHEQGYASHHNETVPNCMGNESRLSDCPTEAPPTGCDELCARVNCIPAKTSSVGQIHLLTQTVSPKTQGVTPSLTSSHGIVVHVLMPSLANPQPQTNTFTVIETPQSSSRIRKRTILATGPFESSTEKESSSDFYNLDKSTITLIGVVAMVIVVAGTAVSVCLIVCRVKKKGSSSIVTGDNMAYAEPKQSMKMYMKKNPAYADLPPVEPIYENLE